MKSEHPIFSLQLILFKENLLVLKSSLVQNHKLAKFNTKLHL